MSRDITRRRLFHGTLGGGAVLLGLPLLDCVLDGNGTAMAAGAPLPVRFGTWFWGCGMNPDRWIPTKTGADWEVPVELKPLEPYRQHINILSGFNAMLDGRVNTPHTSGLWALRTGTAPSRQDDVPDPSLDVLVARAVGGGVRFRSLDMAASGLAIDSYSTNGAGQINPAESTPLGLYTRIFGTGFQDPNAATFRPNPEVMVRRSVLSGFKDQRDALLREAGAADRQKLDAYFTSVRQLEEQLALELEKPAPAEACVVPKGPNALPVSTDVVDVTANHKLMADLLVMALSCHQTKVFNMVFSPGTSTLRRAGMTTTHHNLTHEEPIDGKLGYQPEASYFIDRSMDALGEMVGRLAAVKEGGGTLLDNMLMYAHSDTSFAKIHALEAIPVVTVGRAGGRLKTGLHVAGAGSPVTRTGLTAMQAMRVSVGSWGTASMQTANPISEILA